MKEILGEMTADSLPQEQPETALPDPGMPAVDGGEAGCADAHADTLPTDGREAGEPEAERVIRARFNGEDREVSWDQAKAYVEMGMKWESFRENHEKLKRLALARGVSVSRLIESMAEPKENLMAPGESEAGQEKLLDRLAGDFEVLSEVVPEIHGVNDVPEAVFSLAIEQGISLYDAYLRFHYEEGRRFAREQAAQQAARNSSVGSLRDAGPSPEPEKAAFLTAFRQSVR